MECGSNVMSTSYILEEEKSVNTDSQTFFNFDYSMQLICKTVLGKEAAHYVR